MKATALTRLVRWFVGNSYVFIMLAIGSAAALSLGCGPATQPVSSPTVAASPNSNVQADIVATFRPGGNSVTAVPAPVPTVSAAPDPQLPVKSPTPAESMTATPHPTVCVQKQDDTGRLTEFCFIEWPDPTPTYPRIEGNIHNLVLAFEEKWPIYRPWLGQNAELYRAAQPVKILLSGNPEGVIEWLEGEDVLLQYVYQDDNSQYTLFANVPVSLLADLSKQQSVLRVKDDYSEFSPGYCRYCTSKPVLSVMPVGRERTFFLYSNVGDPTDVRIVVNHPGDTGNVTFSNCPGDENESIDLRNGDLITVTGCSLGVSHIGIYKGDEKYRDYAIEVWQWPEHMELNPTRRVMKVGQSHTFTLDEAVTISSSEHIQIVIKTLSEGNLSFGDCPGAEGDFLPIEEGESVTITACREGSADVWLQVLTDSDEMVSGEGFTISVWE